MSGRNGLITTAELAEILDRAQPAPVRLHDLPRTRARRQQRSLYRRARTAHFRGRAYSGRGFSGSAGRVLRFRHRASLHDAGCCAARGGVRPSRHLQRQQGGAVQHRHPDVGDAVLVDAHNRSASKTLAVLDGGLDKWKLEGRAARNRTGEGISSRRRSRRNRSRGYFVDKHETLAATAERNTVVVNALGPQFHKGLEPSRYGRPGRVPGSCNVSAATLLDPADQGVRPARGSRSRNSRRRASRKTSAWSPIAAAASRRRSTCSCCIGSVTTISRSMTARWANGRRMTSLPIETG